ARLLRRRVSRPRARDRDRARARAGERYGRVVRDPPDFHLSPTGCREVTDIAWIDTAITSARPQAIAALLRYFRDLDTAEEAFHDACLRALKTWPKNGPPRDPAAWLILVGRNVGVDGARRKRKQTALPDEDQLSDLEDVETELVDRLDN